MSYTATNFSINPARLDPEIWKSPIINTHLLCRRAGIKYPGFRYRLHGAAHGNLKIHLSEHVALCRELEKSFEAYSQRAKL